MPIDWWRGSPAILESQRYQAERELRSIGNIAGGVRSGYDSWQKMRDKQEQEKAALIRAYHRSPDQLAAAYSDSQSNVTPEVQDESLLEQGGASVGPSTEARNVSGANAPGTGAGSTPPEETPISRAIAQGRSTAAVGEGPFTGDEPDIVRAMRRIGALMRIPGVKPTQPGLSTAQQTAAISGDLDEMADEAVRVRAFSPLLEVTKDPVAAAQYFAPKTYGTFGVPATAGGGREPRALSRMSEAALIEHQAELYALEEGRNYVTTDDRRRAVKDFHDRQAGSSGEYVQEVTKETQYVNRVTGKPTDQYDPDATEVTNQRTTRTRPGNEPPPPLGEPPPQFEEEPEEHYVPGTRIPLFRKRPK